MLVLFDGIRLSAAQKKTGAKLDTLTSDWPVTIVIRKGVALKLDFVVL